MGASKHCLTTCWSLDDRLQCLAAGAWAGVTRCYWRACLLLHLSRLFELIVECVAFMCCWRADWLMNVLSQGVHFQLCTDELKCCFRSYELLHVLLQCWQWKFMTLLTNLNFWTGKSQQQYTWQKREPCHSCLKFLKPRTVPHCPATAEVFVPYSLSAGETHSTRVLRICLCFKFTNKRPIFTCKIWFLIMANESSPLRRKPNWSQSNYLELFEPDVDIPTVTIPFLFFIFYIRYIILRTMLRMQHLSYGALVLYIWILPRRLNMY